jgi:murein DD-endopeptidase MepM/ murein hydrolase activator NlpD
MSKSRFRGAVPLALFAAFVAGVAVDGWFRTYGPPKPVEDAIRLPSAAPVVSGSSRTPASAPVASGGSRTPSPASSEDRASGTVGSLPSSGLRLPIDGVDVDSLKGGFAETRGTDRPHEAVDMLAPRNTPVHAVENGTIAKLFTSKAGGLTIYQFDPGQRRCYYYAHLERYAEGLHDGQTVSQGEVIGFVGTTGNAPPNTPHLHFAVFELNADKHWWQGKALDPYLVFKERG